jgi:hypothetical protein
MSNLKFLLTQFLAILSANTTAVDDPDVVGDSRSNGLGKVRANVYMCFLCLSGGCDFPSTNSPNWLISNDDVAEQRGNDM